VPKIAHETLERRKHSEVGVVLVGGWCVGEEAQRVRKDVEDGGELLDATLGRARRVADDRLAADTDDAA
jgi:hypothetical protein